VLPNSCAPVTWGRRKCRGKWHLFIYFRSRPMICWYPWCPYIWHESWHTYEWVIHVTRSYHGVCAVGDHGYFRSWTMICCYPWCSYICRDTHACNMGHVTNDLCRDTHVCKMGHVTNNICWDTISSISLLCAWSNQMPCPTTRACV